MTSAMSDPRRLHLVDHSSDRLTPLNQERARLTSENGDGADVDPEPKFLGFCCGPAEQCLCECTLQVTLKAFAVFEILSAGLGFKSSVGYYGAGETGMSIEALISGGILLALGICLWVTAVKFSPKWGYISSFFLAGGCVMSAIDIVLRWNPSPYLMGQLHKKLEEINGQSKKTGTNFKMDMPDFLMLIKAVWIVKAIISLFLSLLILYYIWSFLVRAKRGEYLLLTLGPNNVSAEVPHPVAPQPNYQTQLIRQQPTGFQLPQRPLLQRPLLQRPLPQRPLLQRPLPQRPVEGSQVQQSAMQAAPDAQPPPQQQEA